MLQELIVSTISFEGDRRWLISAVAMLLPMYFLAIQYRRIKYLQYVKSSYYEYNVILKISQQATFYLYSGFFNVGFIIFIYYKNQKFDTTLWLPGCIIYIYFFVKKTLQLKQIFNENFLPPFDVFISYHSDNSEFVRIVCDTLLSLGCNIWLDEYIITSENEFNSLSTIIFDGITRSKFGIAFTDRKYFDSDWCIAEVMLMRCNNCNIIQLCLDDTKIPILEEISVALFPCCNREVDSAVNFISKYIGLQSSNQIEIFSEKSNYIQFGTEHDQFRMDIHGWQLKTLSGDRVEVFIREIEDSGESNPGPVICKIISDNYGKEIMIGMNLYYGVDNKSTDVSTMITKESRLLRGELLNHSKDHIKNIARSTGRVSQIRGTHLIHHGGRGHLGLTYYIDDPGYWTRKIIIHLTREGRDAYEFVFTFGFFGPFREYCRHAHLMDNVATSIEWL